MHLFSERKTEPNVTFFRTMNIERGIKIFDGESNLMLVDKGLDIIRGLVYSNFSCAAVYRRIYGLKLYLNTISDRMFDILMLLRM